MNPTLDSVPGTWTMWVRTDNAPSTTVEYQAVFEPSSPGASEGTVTVTGSTGSHSGTWHEKGSGTDENVTFDIQHWAGTEHHYRFTGYMVGQAMGGYIKGLIGPILSPGSWSAYKTSDAAGPVPTPGV